MLKLRIRLKTADTAFAEKPPSLEQPEDYPFRITSFLLSLGVHCALITALNLISLDRDLPINATAQDLTNLSVHKVLIYDLRVKPLDVAPLKSSGLSPKPQGEEISRQTLIATSPNAKSREQFIWRPVPKLQLKQDLQTPNIIARMATALPAPPVPPKENPPRPEVEGVKAVQPNNSPAQPNGDLSHAPESPAKAVEVPKPIKAFVPPPPLTRQPQLPVPTPMLDAPALEGGSVAMSRLPGGAGMPVFSKATAPAPAAPVAPLANPGNANIDVAIANRHPADVNRELPEGERPGKFAKAPIKGAPSSGEVNGSASLTVPNLTIRENKPKQPEGTSDSKAPVKPTLYSEKVRSAVASTLSVPLRPSSRTIPRAVDARFQGRNVYTMVIPIENLPAYAGDWIIWFAEKEPKPGETPLMRAPAPFRKFEAADRVALGNPAGERVQIMGVLQKDGKLDGLTAIARAGPMVEQSAIRDLASWEFKPATRNGLPVPVDVVIEISLVSAPAFPTHP